MAAESKIFSTTENKQMLLLKRNAEQEQAILDQMLQTYKKHLEEKQKLEAAAQKRLAEAKKNNDQAAIAAETTTLKRIQQERRNAEKEYQTAAINEREKAAKLAESFELNNYKRMNAFRKAAYNNIVAEELRSEKEKQQSGIKIMQQRIAQETDASKKAILQKELVEMQSAKKTTEEQLKLVSDRTKALAKNNPLAFLSNSVKNMKSEATEKGLAAVDKSVAAIDAQKTFKEAAKNDKELIELEKKLQDAKKNGTKKDIQDHEAAIKKREEDLAKELNLTEELETSKADIAKNAVKEIAADTAENLSKAGKKLFEKASNSIEDNLDAMFGMQGRMMGRLQDSGINWKKTVDEVSDTIGFSGIVSKKSVVAKMVELVDSGVAYNLEMRAFLAETSQNIASTFDATNGTLLRLIRLQQSDSTAARLGLEATLTKLFNKQFQDSSYLAENISDNVASAIMDATATLGRDEGLEFEYMVQKWLGSLYSIGASQEVVNTLAQGINYIATGNVSALSNNAALQTLFAMGASRSGGKSYSDLLMGQLTAEDTNLLLKSIIEYLAEISKNQTNYVTKSAYADLFGMSITDLSTFASLTTEEVQNLYNSVTSYDQLFTETENQLSAISNRVSFSKLVDTTIENALVGAASSIGSTGVGYGTWKVLSLLKEYVGEIKIPSILAAGFGLSSDIDLLNTAQTAVVGLGLIGSLLGGLGSMLDGGPTKLSNWWNPDKDQYTQRGQGLQVLTSGASSGVSYSAKIGVGSVNASDVESASLTSAAEAAENASKTTTSEEMQAQQDIYENIYKAISDGESVSVLTVLQEIRDSVGPGRVFYTVPTSSNGAASQISSLSSSVTNVVGSASATPVEEQQPTSAVSSSTAGTNGVSGSSTTTNTEQTQAMSEIIRVAVEEALRAVAGYQGNSGLPVYVTNINNMGG